MSTRDVAVYFDLVSPYSWLALSQIEPFAKRNEITWTLRPVVYAALLDTHDLVGPAETAAKRRYTFHDIARLADELGLSLSGPPAHPFRSLEGLRTICLFGSDICAVRLAVSLSDACWRDGRDLTDLSVLAEVVASVGLDAVDLERRISASEVKDRLRRYTAEAVERGVFGVPTFDYDGELFWGHDRMGQLERRLRGLPRPEIAARAEALLARPRGADRKGAPRREKP